MHRSQGAHGRGLRGRLILAAAAAVVVAGCGQPPDLMPLEAGREMEYVVRSDLDTRVEPVRISREVPVAGAPGFELTGPLGTSRLAWKDGMLLAASTTNARFHPPVPLVTVDGKARDWRGEIEVRGYTSEAVGRLVQEDVDLDLNGKKVPTRMSTLSVTLPRGEIELISWFQRGVGMVQQEQRTNDRLVLRMEMLGGPRP
jgi:hypothetical protein